MPLNPHCLFLHLANPEGTVAVYVSNTSKVQQSVPVLTDVIRNTSVRHELHLPALTPPGQFVKLVFSSLQGFLFQIEVYPAGE